MGMQEAERWESGEPHDDGGGSMLTVESREGYHDQRRART